MDVTISDIEQVVTDLELFDCWDDEGNLDESTVRTAYSGRLMYGDDCLGFVGDQDDAFRLILGLCVMDKATELNDHMVGVDEMFDLISDLPNTNSDSMGTSTIYYWPDVKVVG